MATQTEGHFSAWEYAEFKGQAVLDNEEGGSRLGKVALVLPPIPGQDMPAGVYICWDHEDGEQAESVRWSLDRMVEASSRARLTTQRRNDEQIAKSMISREEIATAAGNGEFIVIEHFGGVVYTISRDLLFVDGGNSISMWRKDKNGKLPCKAGRVDKAVALDRVREAEFERLAEDSELAAEAEGDGSTPNLIMERARRWHRLKRGAQQVHVQRPIGDDRDDEVPAAESDEKLVPELALRPAARPFRAQVATTKGQQKRSKVGKNLAADFFDDDDIRLTFDFGLGGG